jgi:hypothetical protein
MSDYSHQLPFPASSRKFYIGWSVGRWYHVSRRKGAGSRGRLSSSGKNLAVKALRRIA